MNLKKLFPSFRKLKWKLTFYYALVTVISLLVLQTILVLTISLNPGEIHPSEINDLIRSTKIAGQAISPALFQEPIDDDLITQWIADVLEQELLFFRPGFLNTENSYITVTDENGIIYGTSDDVRYELGDSIFEMASAEDNEILDTALQGLEGEGDLYHRQSFRAFSYAVPVYYRGNVVGAVFVEVEQPRLIDSVKMVVSFFLSSFVIFTVFSLFIGVIFGVLIARTFTGRLDDLAEAASAWGNGDFSVRVDDQRGDEISELGADLNRMVEMFETLLKDRQDLAALEERNRLARDLHDSVKQQMFAITMSLGAVDTLWAENPDAAREQLLSVKKLVRQVQAELTNLIQMLRPIQLAEKGLVEAVQDHLHIWEKQSGVAAIYQVEGDGSLSKDISQALFRVVQEALSNISRHSGATAASVALGFVDQVIQVSISDNGHGFDPLGNHKGMGLLSMQERVQRIGGNFEIKSSSAGTQIMIEVPVGNGGDEEDAHGNQN